MKKHLSPILTAVVLIMLFSHGPLYGRTCGAADEMPDSLLNKQLIQLVWDSPRIHAPLFLKTAMTFYKISSDDGFSAENKGQLYRKAGTLYLDNETDSVNAMTFYTAVKPILEAYPSVRDYIAGKVDFIRNQTTDGDLLPFDPVLIDKEGHKTSLTCVLSSRIIYADLWSTGCIPCCREIPHMRNLSKRCVSENTGVTCISLSIDEDFDRWKNYIEKNNLDWPQYLMNQEDAQRFFAHLRIMGIPRFLVIGNDGRILSVNAPRPSDTGIHNYLGRIVEKAIN